MRTKTWIAALLCFILLLTAVACSSSPTPTPPPPPKTYEELKAAYGDIIAQYTTLITAKYNGEELPALNTEGMGEQEAAIADAIYGIVDRRKTKDALKGLGYGYKDLDGNGIPELILLTRYAAHAIFTLSDEKPLLLEAAYTLHSSIVFAPKGRFFIQKVTTNEAMEETVRYIGRVNGDRMAYDAVYGSVRDTEQQKTIEIFQIQDENRISINQETHYELDWEFSQAYMAGGNDKRKLEMPRIHFPLSDSKPDPTLPVADFSDYDAVRKTYQAIGTCLEEFNVQSWINGSYADLMSFPDDTAYEYYNLLLYTIHRYKTQDIGYDEIDLNGDGQDELVFLTEDYSIRAIFTQKEGKPVLLAAYHFGEGWLDDQGLIHFDKEEYYDLEYSLYELTAEGDFELHYSFLVHGNGRFQYYFYLTKDGKTKNISSDEWNALYSQYCRYSEPFDPNEQTRNVSKLTYTPLDETDENFVVEAVLKTWNKYADLEKTTGKHNAFSNTYMTFGNVTDTQIDVYFRYAFTFFYPDPERENYLLDDTTESSLNITAHNKDGEFVFDENGVKGRMEFGSHTLWLIIEESTDERFPVGFHCYGEYSSDKYM